MPRHRQLSISACTLLILFSLLQVCSAATTLTSTSTTPTPTSSSLTFSQSPSSATGCYAIKDDYQATSGVSAFAQKFSFNTENDKTNGYVDYVNLQEAITAGLIRQNSAGNMILGVDSTTDLTGSSARGRKSLRLESLNLYNGGLFIMDVKHMPGGQCGTWPAWWTVGSTGWPGSGEIDIIEGVHKNTRNLQSLHTDQGFYLQGPAGVVTPGNGTVLQPICNIYEEGNSGCGIQSNSDQSYGAPFNAMGGGVYAMQWNDTGIYIWNFPRLSIPENVLSENPDPSSWPSPVFTTDGGSVTAGTLSSHFYNHTMVFDTTFCGDWAGESNSWKTSGCYDLNTASTCQQYVAGNPSAFADTYWEIASLKVFEQSSSGCEAPSVTSCGPGSTLLSGYPTATSTTLSNTNQDPVATSAASSVVLNDSTAIPSTSIFRSRCVSTRTTVLEVPTQTSAVSTTSSAVSSSKSTGTYITSTSISASTSEYIRARCLTTRGIVQSSISSTATLSGANNGQTTVAPSVAPISYAPISRSRCLNTRGVIATSNTVAPTQSVNAHYYCAAITSSTTTEPATATAVDEYVRTRCLFTRGIQEAVGATPTSTSLMDNSSNSPTRTSATLTTNSASTSSASSTSSTTSTNSTSSNISATVANVSSSSVSSSNLSLEPTSEVSNTTSNLADISASNSASTETANSSDLTPTDGRSTVLNITSTAYSSSSTENMSANLSTTMEPQTTGLIKNTTVNETSVESNITGNSTSLPSSVSTIFPVATVSSNIIENSGIPSSNTTADLLTRNSASSNESKTSSDISFSTLSSSVSSSSIQLGSQNSSLESPSSTSKSSSEISATLSSSESSVAISASEPSSSSISTLSSSRSSFILNISQSSTTSDIVSATSINSTRSLSVVVPFNLTSSTSPATDVFSASFTSPTKTTASQNLGNSGPIIGLQNLGSTENQSPGTQYLQNENEQIPVVKTLDSSNFDSVSIPSSTRDSEQLSETSTSDSTDLISATMSLDTSTNTKSVTQTENISTLPQSNIPQKKPNMKNLALLSLSLLLVIPAAFGHWYWKRLKLHQNIARTQRPISEAWYILPTDHNIVIEYIQHPSEPQTPVTAST